MSSSSNLIRFLQCVTPVPPSKFLPQSSVGDLNSQWQPLRSKGTVEYFTLSDLWDCYDEFSAYGAGTEVALEDGDSITQYYVPYLSAIQLFTNKSVSAASRAVAGSEASALEINDSWDEDSRSGSDKLSRSLSDTSAKTWDTVSDDSSYENDGSSPKSDKLGSLYFKYVETCSPYWRVPLKEKVMELAKTHPGLMTLKNVDLSPASWMAVSWYPIYHIPTRRGEKDLETGFLTFHTLSSSFQDSESENVNNIDSVDVGRTASGWKRRTIFGEEERVDGIPLPPFGLATYKLQGDIWIAAGTDYEKMVHLRNAADSWLKQLNVFHHDFNFFTGHSAN
ncbi:hypothetical protein LINGRAPRIM_LOCUS325 [Linum grandiflorum]